MTTKPIASLTLNEKFYPRHHISSANVASIMEAIRLGTTMPAIVISQKTSSLTAGIGPPDSRNSMARNTRSK